MPPPLWWGQCSGASPCPGAQMVRADTLPAFQCVKPTLSLSELPLSPADSLDPRFLVEVVVRSPDLSPSQTHQAFSSEELHWRLTGSSPEASSHGPAPWVTSLTQAPCVQRPGPLRNLRRGRRVETGRGGPEFTFRGATP